MLEESAQELGCRIAQISAHVHAAMAEIVSLATQLDSFGGWRGQGYRSFAHWVSVNCGFDAWMGQEIFRVAQALVKLPLIRTAFAEGRLSFDKVRAVTRVACADEDEMWLGLALDASGTQLARICRAVGSALDVDSSGQAEAQHLRRGLRTQWLKNGMLHVVALLPPADGKLLIEALDAGLVKPESHLAPAPEHALDGYAARRADALTLVLGKGLGVMQNQSDVVAARNQVVVHVDFDLLTGLTDTGKCFLEDGPAIALSTLQRLGCTASVVAMIERNGQVLDVLPARRLPTVRQRRAIAARDKTCLVPGCGVRAIYCEPHHKDRYAFSHRTLVDELASVCPYHHQRVHDGVLRMIQVGPGKFRFETPSGQVIPPVPVAVNPLTGGTAHLEQRSQERGMAIDWETPLARGNGAAFDLGLTVDIAINNPRSRQLERGSPVLPAP